MQDAKSMINEYFARRKGLIGSTGGKCRSVRGDDREAKDAKQQKRVAC